MKPKVAHWFALGEDRALFAFARIWRSWCGARDAKANSVEGEHQLFGLLTRGAEDDRAPGLAA